MEASLSKLANNLSEIYSEKCRGENCESECKFRALKITNFLTIANSVEKNS